jgi:hypothetical protein
MSTINRLSSVDALQPGDLIPVWDGSNGDTRKASLTTLLAFIESNFADPDYSTRVVAPAASGWNVDVGDTGTSTWLVINPVADYALGSISLPSSTFAVNGQEVIVVCTHEVTTFTVTSSGATVSGSPPGLASYSSFRLRYNAAQLTWYTLDNDLSPAFASLVTYTPAGTGAVDETVQNKLRESVSVLDFIPTALHAAILDGTSTTDVSSYIQAAIDSRAQLEVYIPAGTYCIASTLLVDVDTASKYSVNFRGVGLGSHLKWTGASGLPMLYYSSPAGGGASTFATVENIVFENTVRTGDTVLNGVIGIRVGQLQVNGVTVSGTGGCSNVTIRKCQFLYFEIATEVWSESDQLTFEDNWVFVFTVAGIVCKAVASVVTGTGSGGVRVINNQFQGGQNNSVAIDLRGSGLVVTGNVWQNAASGNGLRIFKSTGWLVSGNYTEATGADWAINIVESSAGYIGENEIGAYDGANVIIIDAASKDVTIGANNFSESGGAMLYLIQFLGTTADGINVVGTQRSSNALYTNKFSGSPSTLVAPEVLLTPKIGTTYLGDTNILNTVTSTVLTLPVASAYIVTATSGNTGGLLASIFVSVPPTGAAISTSLGQTSGTFVLGVTGLNVELTNTTGATATYTLSVLRVH